MLKKGQSSTEYLITMGFVIALFIPVSLYAYNALSDYKATLQSQQVTTALTTITEHARSVYNIGAPSFSTINVYFPENIQQIFIQNSTITARVRTVQGLDDITVFGSVPLTGSLSLAQGTRKILITATSSGVSISES